MRLTTTVLGMRNAQPRVSHVATEEQSLKQLCRFSDRGKSRTSSRVTVTAESVFTTHLRRVGEWEERAGVPARLKCSLALETRELLLYSHGEIIPEEGVSAMRHRIARQMRRVWLWACIPKKS